MGLQVPVSCGARGQFVTRQNNIQHNVTGLKSGVRDALDRKDVHNFTKVISQGPHGTVHVDSDCDMWDIRVAGYDTLFYLHHSYVDYLWAFWQDLQRLWGQSNPSIDGFAPRTFSQSLRLYETFGHKTPLTIKQSSVMNTTNYVLFDGLTPAQYLENH